MQQYRQRFVIYTMTLIVFVLAAVFFAIGVFMYRTEMKELEKTMSLVGVPWDEPNGNFMPIDGRPPLLYDDGTDEHLRDTNLRRLSNEGILTVFVDAQTGVIFILNNGFSIDPDDIIEAVEQIISAKQDFGTLKSSGYIYRRENVGSNYKIALADKAYILSRMARNALLLFAGFAFSIVLFFLISLWLSKLAVKPLERATALERQFVADISHDLKTPVTIVLANNSILRSNPEAKVGEQMQWINSTDNAAKNMISLVDGMLTLSALEEKKRVERKSVNLTQIAEKSVLQMESIAYDRRIALESELDDGVFALAEPEYAEKILGGLIENALKYEPEGGLVEVKLSSVRRKARFSVKNNGSFIPSEDLEHIFERFYRGDKARTKSGHGLGLPILKRTAELIGAEIEAVSDKHTGTVFTAVFDLSDN